jgi:hypothetical protein
MDNATEQDFRDYGEDQGFRWDEGFPLDSLVSFEHDGKIIVNPYSYIAGNRNPVELFGTEKMAAWKAECLELFAEFSADA